MHRGLLVNHEKVTKFIILYVVVKLSCRENLVVFVKLTPMIFHPCTLLDIFGTDIFYPLTLLDIFGYVWNAYLGSLYAFVFQMKCAIMFDNYCIYIFYQLITSYFRWDAINPTKHNTQSHYTSDEMQSTQSNIIHTNNTQSHHTLYEM